MILNTMDKRVTAHGITRAQSSHNRKPINQLKVIAKNEDKNFAINSNEFPSLHEVSDKIGNPGKNALECGKSFSYSEKLKKVPPDAKSSLKFEGTSDVSNSGPVFVKEHSVKHAAGFKKTVLKSSKVNSQKNDAESNIEVSQSSGQNQECSGISKFKSPNKSHKINNSERNISLETSQKGARTSNDGRFLKTSNEISSESYQKVNCQINPKPKSVTSTKTLNSQPLLNKAKNLKMVDTFQNAGPSTSNKRIDASASNFQNNFSRNEGNNSNNKGVHPELASSQPEVKKKKKRKSKVKRQAGLQTGKILVLTPEAHSRIFNQSNITNSKKTENVVVNINDCEEYPELGSSVVLKHNKENNVKQIEVSSKNTPVVSTEVKIEKFESNLLASQPISATEKTEATVLKEDRDAINKSSDSEKTASSVKDPNTLTLFDILLTAKPRKKEVDKKNELSVQDSLWNAGKPLSKIVGKKEVSHAVNPLDSSRPAVKRGKEREKPKIKKPSRMRKLILMGRKLRKEEMTFLEESEKTDTSNTGQLDEMTPSNVTEYIRDSLVETFNYHADNIMLFENDYVDSKGSSSNENSSEISSSNEESPNESTSNDQLFSNNCGIGAVLAKESCEIKTSDIFSSKDSVNHIELKEEDETTDEESLKRIYSANELFLNNFKEYEEQVSFSASKSSDFLGYEEKCVLNNASAYAKIEDIDLEMRKIKNILFAEKTFYPSSDGSEEHNCDLSTYQTFSGCNIINDSGSNILEESPSVNILDSVLKGNDSVVRTDSSLKTKICVSFSSISDKGVSSLATNSLNIEDSQKEDPNCFDSNENTASSGNLVQQVGNNISMNTISDEEKSEAVKTMIHSRKFRKYCNHFVTKEIDKVVFTLLDDLARFQDRLHQKDPVKARVRKRLLYGIKEIKRHTKVKKLKGIILATDIEDIKTEGGLNDVIDEIISLAETYHIPYIFSQRRFNLGKVCRKGVAVSCVGIVNYEGSEKNFKRILELQEESKQDYHKVTKALDAVLTNSQIRDVLKLGKGVAEKLYEERTGIMREHFKPDSNLSEAELNVSEISTNNADSKDSNVSVCEKSNLVLETNTSESSEFDKNEIHSILLKYNIL